MAKYIINLTFESDSDLVETGFAINHLLEEAENYEHPLTVTDQSIRTPYPEEVGIDVTSTE